MQTRDTSDFTKFLDREMMIMLQKESPPRLASEQRFTHHNVLHGLEGFPQLLKNYPFYLAGPKLELLALDPWSLAPEKQDQTQAGKGSHAHRRAHLQQRKEWGDPAGRKGGIPLRQALCPSRGTPQSNAPWLCLDQPRGHTDGKPETRVGARC